MRVHRKCSSALTSNDELPHKIEHEAKRAGEVVKRLRDFSATALRVSNASA
jgi:hypothetical protein